MQVVRLSEFHEVIDSAAMLLQVLGARDSTEDRRTSKTKTSKIRRGVRRSTRVPSIKSASGNFNVDDAFNKVKKSKC